MDIISHGLWGGAAFGRKNKKNFWTAFAIGMLPDLLAFTGPFITNLFGITSGPHYSNGRPDAATIAPYVYSIYNFSHSLVIFGVIFLAVWALRKKPLWLLGAWGLHILVDIPTHGVSFFPTPFLWPVSNFHVNGINWGNPIIFFPNLILLAVVYTFWGIRRYKLKKK